MIGSSNETSDIDKVLNNCIECGLCLDECDFLQKFCTFPKELALNFKKNGFSNAPHIPYSCNICSLCKIRCPEGLDLGRMTLEMREEMVENGTGPLPQHAPVIESQKFYVSDEFKIEVPSKDMKTSSIFFPGCSLSAYSPELVIKTYNHLKIKLPGTGIMMGCCGGPAYLTGDNKYFKQISNDMATEMKKLGAKQLIVACPFCYDLLQKYLPNLNPVSLYEILNKIGVPEKSSKERTFNIHDPCTARYEPEVQSNIRRLIKMAGHNIVEIKHNKGESHCCGMGGMVYVIDEELGKLKSKRTLDESEMPIITYCATCRETLQGQGGQVIHILDLIFNPTYFKALKLSPNTEEVSKKNMKYLKNYFNKKTG